MKKTLFVSLAVLLMMILLAVSPLFAQTPPPPALPGMPDQAPLGSLWLLILSGSYYAWRKLRIKQL
jgi:hypothetical protein